MTSKNYRAPLVHYIKLCASSQTPWWIRTAVAVRKRSIPVKISDFLPSVTLKFNEWPWKTIGILFYVTLSFVHHFIRAKMGDFLSGPCDLQIWWMTLKNNRAPLLCCFKLYASFHNHRWIQTKVTVRKRSIRVKIDDFFPVWPRNLTNDLEKQ